MAVREKVRLGTRDKKSDILWTPETVLSIRAHNLLCSGLAPRSPSLVKHLRVKDTIIPPVFMKPDTPERGKKWGFVISGVGQGAHQASWGVESRY